MRTLHVAAAQIQARAGDTAGNLARLTRQVEAAAVVGVEVILFAETVLHSYCLEADNTALAEPADGPLLQAVAALAARHRMTIMPGFLERAGDGLYNSHAVVRPNGDIMVQRKHMLTKKETDAGLLPGPRERTLFTLNGISCAVLICADTGIPNISPELAAQGVELRFIPTAGGDLIEGRKVLPLHEADLATPEGQAAYLKYRALTFTPEPILPPERCATAYVAANALGYDGRDVTHMGHCTIVDRQRILRAQIAGTVVSEHQQDQLIHTVLHFPAAT